MCHVSGSVQSFRSLPWCQCTHAHVSHAGEGSGGFLLSSSSLGCQVHSVCLSTIRPELDRTSIICHLREPGVRKLQSTCILCA
jgi:hypothetical protein